MTATPKVSVLLPNLNNRQFLEERFQTILDQTLMDWELVVVDSYSDDGAWELIQEFAARDNRIRISQTPREGIYAGWNSCIRSARGEYVYIATSDDTMTPDCLEKMVQTLDAYPECDLCHCCLHIIDENGNPADKRWEDYLPQRFYGDLTYRRHIRKAPLDGILHFGLHIMYASITQLLIRRSVFDKVGLFRDDWGSCGDFEWGMRASLICSTFHLPEYLATWRKHKGQATQPRHPPKHRQVLLDMALQAVENLREHDNDLYRKLDLNRFARIYRKEELCWAFRCSRTWGEKALTCLKYGSRRPHLLTEWLWNRVSCKLLHRETRFLNNVQDMKRLITQLGLLENIHVVDANDKQGGLPSL